MTDWDNKTNKEKLVTLHAVTETIETIHRALQIAFLKIHNDAQPAAGEGAAPAGGAGGGKNKPKKTRKSKQVK